MRYIVDDWTMEVSKIESWDYRYNDKNYQDDSVNTQVLLRCIHELQHGNKVLEETLVNLKDELQNRTRFKKD